MLAPCGIYVAPGLPEFEVTGGRKEWLLSANGQWDEAIGRGPFQDQSQVLLPGLKYSTITTNVRYLTPDYLDFFVIWLKIWGLFNQITKKSRLSGFLCYLVEQSPNILFSSSLITTFTCFQAFGCHVFVVCSNAQCLKSTYRHCMYHYRLLIQKSQF